ncbi:MAG: ATP synthase F1 subunit gamma [Verrucomicrobiae bacterium]|nr:ATP synthase F1 subunit gamma [Verrucomicrobiae bacterium]
MSNVRDIRRRIKSVRSTAKITKAMQMVATSKMRRAQQQALMARPYAMLANKILAHCAASVDQHTHPLLDQREVKKTGVLLISTDRGLCGSLNTNLFRETLQYDAANTVFVTVGRKGKAFLARTGKKLLADFELMENARLAQTRKVSGFLTDLFLKGEIDRLDVLYSEFINTSTQRPMVRQILPIKELKALQVDHRGNSSERPALEKPLLEPEFEPSAAGVLGALLPHYVHFEVFQCFMEAKASEHSSRMVAMKNATDNAKELDKHLVLQANKMRQASITNEILEIATAQAAMS